MCTGRRAKKGGSGGGGEGGAQKYAGKRKGKTRRRSTQQIKMMTNEKQDKSPIEKSMKKNETQNTSPFDTIARVCMCWVGHTAQHTHIHIHVHIHIHRHRHTQTHTQTHTPQAAVTSAYTQKIELSDLHTSTYGDTHTRTHAGLLRIRPVGSQDRRKRKWATDVTTDKRARRCGRCQGGGDKETPCAGGSLKTRSPPVKSQGSDK